MASPLGSVIGAFASNSVAPVYYNKIANKNLNWLGNQFQGDNSTYQNALNAFTNANAATTAKMNTASNAAYNDYNNLYQQNANYDPLDTYATLRTGNLNALKDWSGQLENAGSKNDKLALANMGMGGTPDSSYASILRADRVSQNLAPVLGNIMSSLGSDTTAIGNSRSQNLSNLTGLINDRSNAPMLGYGLQLDPANALNSIRNNQIGQLSGTIDAAKNNTAGFQQKTDTLGQVANSMNGFNDALWQNVGNAMSVYSSLYGGGMGGGGGIKTGSSPVGNGTFNMSGNQSSGNSGGGMNMNSLMSLIKMFQGSGNGGNSTVSNPWANYGGTNGSMNYYDSSPSYDYSGTV